MPDIGDFIRRSRRSAKIAIAAPGTPGDFRRSRRSAYKIAKCVAGLSYFLLQKVPSRFVATNKTFGDTCLVPTVSFLQFFCEIRLVVKTMLKNIRCFIVFIVILVLGSFRKQGIAFSFFALEYEVEKIK